MELTEAQKKTLNKLVMVAGLWKDAGEKEKGLELQFEDLLAELHAERNEALNILHNHIS